jgi:hypothetical protein
MSSFFGSGVTLHRLDPAVSDVKVQRGPMLDPPAVRVGELVNTTLRSTRLEPPAVSSRTLDSGWVTAQSQTFKFEVVKVQSHDFRTFKLTTRANAVPEAPRPRVNKDLSAVRGLPVLKRVVPVRFMTPEQATYWVQRLGQAKRVNPRLVNLVGIFPNVPLSGEQPVQFRADEGAIAFHLPEKPVPLSTVVVAKHATTGEVLIGRFHAE